MIQEHTVYQLIKTETDSTEEILYQDYNLKEVREYLEELRELPTKHRISLYETKRREIDSHPMDGELASKHDLSIFASECLSLSNKQYEHKLNKEKTKLLKLLDLKKLKQIIKDNALKGESIGYIKLKDVNLPLEEPNETAYHLTNLFDNSIVFSKDYDSSRLIYSIRDLK